MSTFYEGLGLKTTINAAATFTVLGGSLMSPEVLAAMNAAAGAYVNMHELHLAVGRRLAEATGNEAAYVTSGCAAGIVLAVLAARNGGDPGRLPELPGHQHAPHEVIMHAAHRIPYDRAVALAGGTIRQIGDMLGTFSWELEGAINANTAAVLYVAGAHMPQMALPLEEVVRIAHAAGIPVIVDAAAQLPPAGNLRRFSAELGADAVIFSGGKALRGPQASGLMVGREGFIEAVRQNGAPHQRWGRALKAGKEEIAGLLAAVERFVALDHEGLRRGWRQDVQVWHDGLAGMPGVRTTIEEINEAGQHVPRLHVAIDDPGRAAAVVGSFDDGNPRLAVYPQLAVGVTLGFWLTPDLLQPGQVPVVLERVRTALEAIG